MRKIIIHNHLPRTRDYYESPSEKAELSSKLHNKKVEVKKLQQRGGQEASVRFIEHEIRQLEAKLASMAKSDFLAHDGENFNVTATMKPKSGGSAISKSIELAAQSAEMARTAATNWWRSKGFVDINVTKAEPG